MITRSKGNIDKKVLHEYPEERTRKRSKPEKGEEQGDAQATRSPRARSCPSDGSEKTAEYTDRRESTTESPKSESSDEVFVSHELGYSSEIPSTSKENLVSGILDSIIKPLGQLKINSPRLKFENTPKIENSEIESVPANKSNVNVKSSGGGSEPSGSAASTSTFVTAKSELTPFNNNFHTPYYFSAKSNFSSTKRDIGLKTPKEQKHLIYLATPKSIRNRNVLITPRNLFTDPLVVMEPDAVARLDAASLGFLRDAMRLLPEFNGNRENLSRYTTGLEEALAMVGPASESHLLRLAKTKLSSTVWNKISKITFENIKDFVNYLRKTYDPPRDVFQLTGELGSSFQEDSEKIDDYADRIRDLAVKILEAHKHADGALAENEKERIEKMALSVFGRGLKPEIRREMGDVQTLSDAINKARDIERELADLDKLRKGKNPKDKSTEKSEKSVKSNKTEKSAEINFVSTDRTPGNKNQAGGSFLTCQYCGKKGHAAKSCYAAQAASGQQALVTCQMCEKKGHAANNCPQLTPPPQVPVPSNAVTSTGQVVICSICSKRGHPAEKCFSNPCKVCGKKGHLTENCFRAQQTAGVQAPATKQIIPQPQVSSGQTQPPAIQCFGCQGWGHFARDCPSRKNSGGNVMQSVPQVASPMTYAQASSSQYPPNMCRYCKTIGHRLEECPARIRKYGNIVTTQGNGNGQPESGVQVEATAETHPTLSLRVV